MQIFCSSKFHSRFNLTIILAQFLNFQPQNSFHIHQVTSFCTEDTSFFYYRYHQFIDSYFSMAYIIHFCSYLGLKLSQIWPVGAPSSWCPYHILSKSSLSDVRRYSWLILYSFSCSSPGINHFSEEPRFLLVGNGIRNEDLAAPCAHCYWGISLPLGPSVHGTETYVYTYVYTRVFYFRKSWIYTYTSNSNPSHWAFPHIPTSVFVFFHSENPGSHKININEFVQPFYTFK